MMQGLNRKAFSGPSHGTRRNTVVARAGKQQQLNAVQLMVSTASALAVAAPVQAAEQLASTAVADGSLPFAVGGGVAIAGLGALLMATDPQKRLVRSDPGCLALPIPIALTKFAMWAGLIDGPDCNQA